MDDKGPSSLKNMCRTCMKRFPKIQKESVINKKQCIYEVPTGYNNNASIMELLQLIHPDIKIDMKDNLPTLMCSDCITKLLEAYEFIETYKEVDKKFRKILEEFDKTNSKYELKSVNDNLELMEEKDHSVEVLDDIDDEDEITNVEFEIEDVRNDSYGEGQDNENEMDWTESEEQHSNEIPKESIKRELCLINSYNDDCDKEWTQKEIFQKKRRQRKSNIKINTETKSDNNSAKTQRKMVLQSQDENDTEIDLQRQNEGGFISCQECDAILENVTSWQQHMRQHRLGKIPKIKYTKKSKKNYECEYCSKVFPRNTAYQNHVRTHTGEEPYLCIECGKSFKVVSSLNTHMLRHKGEKTIQCPHCPKKFVCSSGLYGHMMVHTKEKPFVCDICGSAFHMAYQLRNHNLYHNGIKNFQCEYCDMRFVTSEKQRRHMRTHTGEKPYRCKYCERAFAQSNDCIKHLRQHLGDNVYQCELCPLRFPLARDLRVHFATHKDDDEETRARNLQARLEEERNLQIKLGVHES